MSRFLQLTDPTNIDFIYNQPQAMMLKVIENADNQLDKEEEQSNLLLTELSKIKSLDADKGALTGITDQYKTKVNDLTTQLVQNPQDWRKNMPVIRDLSRQVLNDFTKGDISKIQGNYDSYQTWNKEQKERIKSGKVAPDWFDAANKTYLGDYKGYKDPETGTYNTFSPSALPEQINVSDRVDKWLTGVMSNSKARGNTQIGKEWLVDVEGKKEWVSKERLQQIALNKFAGDQELQSYLRTGSQIGIWKDPAKEALMPSINAAVDKYAFMKDEQSSKTHENPQFARRESQAHQTAERIAGEQHQEKMQQQRQERENFKDIAELQGKADAGDEEAKNILKYRKSGGKQVQIVGDNMEVGYEKADYQGDNDLLSNLSREINDAKSSGNLTLTTQKEAEYHDASDRILNAKTAGYQHLYNLGYTKDQVTSYIDYITNTNNYRNEILQGMGSFQPYNTDKNTDMVEYNNRMMNANNYKMQYNNFKKMQKQVDEGIGNYYSNTINKHTEIKQGLSLDAFPQVTEATVNYIKQNPENFKLYDKNYREINTEATTKAIDVLTGKSNDGSVTLSSVVNDNGTSFKVVVDGKSYLGKFIGDNNLDNVMAKQLEGNADPKAIEFRNQITSPVKKSMLYNVNKLAEPGQSTRVPIKVATDASGNTTTNRMVQFELRADGFYDVKLYYPETNTLVPLFDNPVTKEYAVDKIGDQL